MSYVKLTILVLICLIRPCVSEEKKRINLIWQCSKAGLWEVEWILELLSDFDVKEIVDGNYQVAIDKSIIVTGKYCGDYFSKLKQENKRFGVIHISDEVYSHPTHFYDQCPFVFRTYWHKKFKSQENVHCFALGYKQGMRQRDLKVPSKDITQRDLTWSFAGGIQDQPTRWSMLLNMCNVPNFHLHEIPTWNHSSSLSVKDYSNLLLRSTFIPCPRGYWNLDSFRVYEALECGCIPIVEKQPLDYFTSFFGDHPFLSVNSWDEAPALINALLEEPLELERLRGKCHQWWLDYKAKTRSTMRELIHQTFFELSEEEVSNLASSLRIYPEQACFIHARSAEALPAELLSSAFKNKQYLIVYDINDLTLSGESQKWNAITDFLGSHCEWQLKDRRFDPYDHFPAEMKLPDLPYAERGLAILEHRPPLLEVAEREQRIDEALKHRIILCTGPAYRSRQLLIDTIHNDQKHIPFKKIFLSTNDPACCDVGVNCCPLQTYPLEVQGHQLDCLNCMITTIRNASQDPECQDDDILLFKHETVCVNDMYLVRGAVGKILDGFDMVIRRWVPDDFLMTDVFMMRLGAVRELFKEREPLHAFPEEHPFAERYFTNVLVAPLSKIYKIDYWHATRKETELGFFHLPKKGEEYSSGYKYWDKENYMELFK